MHLNVTAHLFGSKRRLGCLKKNWDKQCGVFWTLEPAFSLLLARLDRFWNIYDGNILGRDTSRD